jgi:hypothetical protein
METTLIRATECGIILLCVLVTGCLLGLLAGWWAMRQDRIERERFAAHVKDLMHSEPVPMIDVQAAIRRAVDADRSNRSRKGWQTRKAAEIRDRKLQHDADIRVLIGSDGGAM